METEPIIEMVREGEEKYRSKANNETKRSRMAEARKIHRDSNMNNPVRE